MDDLNRIFLDAFTRMAEQRSGLWRLAAESLKTQLGSQEDFDIVAPLALEDVFNTAFTHGEQEMERKLIEHQNRRQPPEHVDFMARLRQRGSVMDLAPELFNPQLPGGPA
jgi:hypothetical protein